MQPIETSFHKKKKFVGFVIGGDGGVDYCVECCLQLIQGGVDILEIGFPFSDPVADGVVIQRASQRSLEAGTNSSTLLEIARRIRQHSDIPLVLFSYYNPILQKGENYLNSLKAAGYDAMLTVDISPSQATEPHFSTLRQRGLVPIFLVSPSTDDQRLSNIAENGAGFLYYACQKGTTGTRRRMPDDIEQQISRIRKKSKLPIVVGFGIGDRQSASEALEHADGFVVGSAFVHLMEQKTNPVELKKLAQAIDPRNNVDL